MLDESSQSSRIQEVASLERSWTDSEAKEVVEGQEASGRTIRAFCKEHDVSEQRFHWWKTKLKKKAPGYTQAGNASKARKRKLVEVRVRETTSSSPLELALSGGRVLRVPTGFDETELKRLLSVLEAPC